MNIRLLSCLLATFCILSLGFAQCPDSVQVYVNPEVICPGDVVRLSTDSLQIHCVNIGDIICVHNDSHDTAIVSLEEWTNLQLSNSYSSLAIVFYVDETCQHGWAVKDSTSFKSAKWTLSLTNCTDIPSIQNFPCDHTAFEDLDGNSNTTAIQATGNTGNYPILSTFSSPFYIPSIGQLNYLYAQVPIINHRINTINDQDSSLLTTLKWWSSTESNRITNGVSSRYALYLENGVVGEQFKTGSNYVIPIMNF